MRALVLGVVLVNSALLAALELMLQPLYVGAVPVPAGTVVALATMPWLVRTAASTHPVTAAAAAPIVAWILVVGVLGLGGPGADVLLPANGVPGLMSLLLVVGALGAGLYALRGVILTAGRDSVDASRG